MVRAIVAADGTNNKLSERNPEELGLGPYLVILFNAKFEDDWLIAGTFFFLGPVPARNGVHR